MNKNFHKKLFASTVMILVIVMVQSIWHPLKIKELKGAYIKKEFPRLTFQAYKDNSFQKQFEDYYKDHFGFREYAIRLYNQYLWSCYRKTNVNTVALGKDNYLYETYFVIEHYESLMHSYANDTSEMKKIFDTETLRLWKVQEILKEYDIHIFVNMLPGKDMIYPEYLPEKSKNPKPEGIRAYDYYKTKFEEYGINHIDVASYFKELKGKVDYPLFTKKGTHWSNIASAYTFDTIIRYMEHIGDKNILNLQYSEKYKDRSRHPDNDLEELYNLCVPSLPNVNYYTDVSVIQDPTADSPGLLTIGDSFYWNIIYNVPLKDIFRSCPYWFYNSTIYEDKDNKSTKDIDFVAEVMDIDYIMLNYCNAQLYKLGNKFIAKALVYLCYDQEEIDKKIEEIKVEMKKSEQWNAEIAKKALENNESVEVTMYNEALNAIIEEPEKYFEELSGEKLPLSRNKSCIKSEGMSLFESKVQSLIDYIYSDEKWLEDITTKARNNNVSTEEQVRIDAEWMVREEMKGQN